MPFKSDKQRAAVILSLKRAGAWSDQKGLQRSVQKIQDAYGDVYYLRLAPPARPRELSYVAHTPRNEYYPFCPHTVSQVEHAAAVLKLYPEGRWLRSSGVFVHPDFRGKRIGTRLYLEALKLSKGLGLKGVASSPSSEQEVGAAKLWDRLRTRRVASPEDDDEFSVMTRVRPHSRRRGKLRRLLGK
jgi:GNAT superfamily N-acetyltransferase